MTGVDLVRKDWYLALLVVLGVVTGCRQENDLPLAPVTGTVTYQDKLLDRGEVVFLPQDGTAGPPAVGKIQPDGTFAMLTAGRRGASIGSHKVTVHYRRELTPAEIEQRSLNVPESLIPDKYWKQDRTPLSFVVEDKRSNVYDIVLE